MSVNIKTEKILSPSAIKKIIAIGISLRDEMEAVEKGLISDYDSTATYTRGMSCYYDGYLYKCIYTTTGDFDSSKWQKVGDELDLVTLDEIKSMIGLTNEQITTLQSLILDSEIRLDKTFSSSKIYTDLQQCLNDSKTFTLQEFAKASKASYHVVTSTSEMTDKSVIYLMPNSTNYDMYIVESNGTPTKIGDTTIDLSQYAKLSDLNNYYDKATSDGKYATITTVDGKVDKTSILSTISSTPSDDKLLSEKAVKSELDTINTNLDDKIDKASITTTINSSSTDSQVPSAKSVYYNCIEGIGLDQTVIDTYGTEILKYPLGIWRINGNNFASKFTDLPVKASGRIEITSIDPTTNKNPFTSPWNYRVYNFETYLGENYIRKISSNATAGVLADDSGWQKICTTSVADVPKTKITSNNTDLYTIGQAYYCVKNGICYINFWPITVKKAGASIKTGKIFPHSLLVRASGALVDGNGNFGGQAYIGESGELRFDCILANTGLYCTISYPVE